MTLEARGVGPERACTDATQRSRINLQLSLQASVPRHFPALRGNDDTRQDAAAQLFGSGPGGIALQAPHVREEPEKQVDTDLPSRVRTMRNLPCLGDWMLSATFI